MTFLDSLPPGARFRTESGRTGTLLRAGTSSCKVRWEERHRVELETEDGAVAFDASGRTQEVAPQTEVVQIGQPSTEVET